MIARLSIACLSLVFLASLCAAKHAVLQGNQKLAVVAADGFIVWQMPWGGIHDLHLLENGNILTRQGRTAVAEIDRNTSQVIWNCDSANSGGNSGKRVEVHAFERLPNGHTMIAESGVGRIIEVDQAGKIQHEIPLVVDMAGQTIR